MDKLALTDLQALIDLLRANGITQYRSSDLELTLGAVVAQSAAKESQPTQQKPEERTDYEKALSTLPNGDAYLRAFGTPERV